LRDAAQWKAKALHARQAAELLKQKAEALKEKALATVEQNKELNLSFRKARHAAQEYQRKAEQAVSRVRELEASQEQQKSAGSQLSALEQQLTLYRTALKEARKGSELQKIVETIRTALTEPGVEEALRLKLQTKESELQAALSERESFRDDLWANRTVLENKIEKLEAENQALKEQVEKLTEAQERSTSDQAYTEQKLIKQLRDVQFQLGQKTLALARQEEEFFLYKTDTQSLVEDLHNETESLRSEIGMLSAEKLELEENLEAKITLLEDERSDLEIVNAELQQRIAELERRDSGR